MITCSIQSEEGSARKCPVILRRLLLKNMESWHRNSTRPFPMYMAGMPLELVSQWLGHSQLETSLIYARATTDMKRRAVDKISAKENSVFKSDEKFKYADNEDVIRQLYGLM